MRHRLGIVVLVAAAVLVTVGGVAGAQGGYDLSWWTVDGGGETLSTGPGYSLGGTAGQPDAGPVMSGGDYQLTGGLWAGGAGVYRVYLPVIVRSG